MGNTPTNMGLSIATFDCWIVILIINGSIQDVCFRIFSHHMKGFAAHLSFDKLLDIFF